MTDQQLIDPHDAKAPQLVLQLPSTFRGMPIEYRATLALRYSIKATAWGETDKFVISYHNKLTPFQLAIAVQYVLHAALQLDNLCAGMVYWNPVEDTAWALVDLFCQG